MTGTRKAPLPGSSTSPSGSVQWALLPVAVIAGLVITVAGVVLHSTETTWAGAALFAVAALALFLVILGARRSDGA